ncbi:MAG: hypothetical protein OXK21_10565 [Chloroflexota bacterium]|nr:hypothetical protein [Chloroflexota bacterium]
MAIGEAYFAVRHHYGVPERAARTALLDALQGGLVAPLEGEFVLECLTARGGAGLMDRFILQEYARREILTLTLDRRMATLPGARPL